MTVSVQTPKSGPYDGDGSTVAFAYGFKIEAASELIVEVLTAAQNVVVQTLTTDYSVSGVGNASGGTVTFVNPPASGTKISIRRDTPIQQSVDLQNRKVVDPQTLEEMVDDVVRAVQDLDERTSRAVKVDVFDVSDLDQLLVDIPAVATNEANINAVAGELTDIATVAGDIADVSTVAADIADLRAVADIFVQIVTLAANIGDINDVAADIANVNTVAGDIADVTTVAGISADVTAVAAIDSDVSTVAGDSADIQTLAGISADITALANTTGGNIAGNWDFTGTFEVSGDYVVSTESYTWNGAQSLSQSNGLVQDILMNGNITFSDGLADGESIILHIDDGSAHTITWPTITWVSQGGNAPSLLVTGDTVITIWKIGTTLYGYSINGL